MIRITLFLLVNFAALGLGSLLMGNPARNVWYLMLNKAPWTPPGWVFGIAWFSIMACFSVFMFYLTRDNSFSDYKFVYFLFIIQWILNVSWNPVFFRWHQVAPGLALIICLTLVVMLFTWYGFKNVGYIGLLMLPYLLWLLIATSLNAYILLRN